jgi:hypothetical protein
MYRCIPSFDYLYGWYYRYEKYKETWICPGKLSKELDPSFNFRNFIFVYVILCLGDRLSYRNSRGNVTIPRSYIRSEFSPFFIIERGRSN